MSDKIAIPCFSDVINDCTFSTNEFWDTEVNIGSSSWLLCFMMRVQASVTFAL